MIKLKEIRNNGILHRERERGRQKDRETGRGQAFVCVCVVKRGDTSNIIMERRGENN